MGQIVTDSFNRANSTGLGADWTNNITDQGRWDIASTLCFGATSNGAALSSFTGGAWTGGADQYSEAQIFEVSASDKDCGPAVRCSGSVASNSNCYLFDFNDSSPGLALGSSTFSVSLYKLVNGTYTQLGVSVTGQTVNAGDVIRVEVTGTGVSTIVVGKINGTTIITRTDTAGSIASGNPGLFGVDVGWGWLNFAAGDFSGGDISATPTESLKVVDQTPAASLVSIPNLSVTVSTEGIRLVDRVYGATRFVQSQNQLEAGLYEQHVKISEQLTICPLIGLPAHDEFNGVASGVLDPCNWTQAYGQLGVDGSGHAYRVNPASSLALWKETAFSPDQYSQVTVTAYNGDSPAPCVRISPSGDASYAMLATPALSQINLYQTIANVGTLIQTVSSVSLADGDVLRLQIVGTTLSMFLNGTQVGTNQIDTGVASGQPGIYCNNGGATATLLDNFVANNIGVQAHDSPIGAHPTGWLNPGIVASVFQPFTLQIVDTNVVIQQPPPGEDLSISLVDAIKISDTAQTRPNPYPLVIPAESAKITDTVQARISPIQLFVPAESLKVQDVTPQAGLVLPLALVETLKISDAAQAALNPYPLVIPAEALKLSDSLQAGLTAPPPLIQAVYEAKFDGVNWTNFTPDVIDAGASTAWGITTGNGPLDSVAGSGTCTFLLRNDLDNGHPIGYYSPNHAACRAGWTFGIPFRLSYIFNGSTYQRFTGKVYSILPDSGIHERRQVAVTAYDIMRDLSEIDLNTIGIQVSMTESQIIANIIASLPAASQPFATSYDSGVDTFPYALDTIGSGAKALSVIADVARSSFSLVFCKSDGTFTVINRHTRTLGSAAIEFSGDFIDFQVPSDLSNVYNLARVVIHPKTIDAAATTVLYALTGTVPSISAGQTLTLWGTYNDPANAQRLVGGLSMVTTLVAYPSANWDYAGNAAADGSGSNLTSSLSIVATAFATTVKFEITNTGGASVYLIEPSGTTGPKLRIRGKGVYDRGPQTYQSSSTQPYGTRPIDIDMPYQADPNVGQSTAEYVVASYKTLSAQVKQLTFIANDSPAHMLFALTVEPGTRLIVSETVTGISAITATVQSVALTMTEKYMVVVINLAPVSPFTVWLWGIVGQSEWGITTVYGF